MTALRILVIYADPLDYPGRFVARWQTAGRGGITIDTDPVAVADSLADARAVVPRDLVCLPRHPDDDPAIVECWL